MGQRGNTAKKNHILKICIVFTEILLAGAFVVVLGIYLFQNTSFLGQREKSPDLETKQLQWEPVQQGPIQPEPEVQSSPAPEETQQEVTLLFAGDTLLDDNYSPMVSLKQRPGGVKDCFSEDLLAEMTGADIFMLNNEFTFTDRGEQLPDKSYTFRASTENVKYLLEMGVDLVSLANNHTFDWGEISLLDTLDTLEAAGIPKVGAGRNLKEASAPVFFDIGKLRIGFLAATQIERMANPPTRGAKEEVSGVFRCMDPTALYEAVRETKEQCDFLVVFVHWGTEKMEQPDRFQLEQGPGLAEAGADLVIGAHPHVLQGLDSIGGVPVIYSLGNFWFNSFTQDSCVVKVTLNEEGLKSLQFLPALQKGCYTSLLHDEEKQRVLDYVRSLSPHVEIDADGFVTFF